MAPVPTLHLDLNDPAFVRDPYPLLSRLRARTPVFYDPTWNKVFFTRYADIARVLRDRRFGRSVTHVLSRDELGWPPPDSRQADFDRFQDNHMLDAEPPKHTRLRALVGQAFTPRRVEVLRAQVERLVGETLDRLAERDSFDLVRDFAEPLPVAVIAELLGVPPADRPLLRPWSADIVRLYELGYTPEDQRRANTAVVEFSAYLNDLARERRARPTDDLISALVRAEQAGDTLSAEELVGSCILLLNAGHEASVNGTVAAVRALLGWPGAWRALARAPQNSPPLARAVEELLRFDTPLPLFERWVLEDLELNGVRLERGQEVALLYASGNRDPEQFSRPDILDLSRDEGPHLSFGLGVHYCLGAPLARLEMGIALSALARRFPKLTPLQDEVEYGGFVIRGARRFEVAPGEPRNA